MKRPAVAGNQTQDTSGLCSQCSATELRQLDNWLHKPEVSWVRFPATTGLLTFLYFRLITSKFSLFQHEARVLSTNVTDSWSWFSLLVFITVIVQTLVCCVSLVSVPGSLPRKLRKKEKTTRPGKIYHECNG